MIRLYVKYKQNNTNEFIYKMETDSQKTTVSKKEQRTGGINWEWENHTHTTIYKINNQQGPTA